jgi:Na+-transporting NADH:ubiquinone oxidoreductase subunit NqrB
LPNWNSHIFVWVYIVPFSLCVGYSFLKYIKSFSSYDRYILLAKLLSYFREYGLHNKVISLILKSYFTTYIAFKSITLTTPLLIALFTISSRFWYK